MDIDSVTECKIESGKADVIKLANEQQTDQTQKSCFSLLKRAKGEYFLKNDLLYRVEPAFGQMTEMLVVPNERRKSVLHLAHDLSHQAMRKTRDRVRGSGLTWPTLKTVDCREYASHCSICQKKARVTMYDRQSTYICY